MKKLTVGELKKIIADMPDEYLIWAYTDFDYVREARRGDAEHDENPDTLVLD